jgi:hypothetical protein
LNSVNVLKALRYAIANDAELRSIMGETTENGMLERLHYRDSIYSSRNASGRRGFKYPHFALSMDDDNPQIRGGDDNSVMLEIIIVNLFKNTSSALVNIQLKDRLKELLEDSHEVVNARGLILSPPVNIKVRDIAWVSAVNYTEKEQGSERLHKYICNMKLVIGD